MSTTLEAQQGVMIRRGLGIGAILGMGIAAERLEADGRQVRYEGVEWQWGLWRRVRVDRTVHLKDVVGLTRSFGINPLFILLALLSLFNLVANLADWYWWFATPVWALPFLGVGQEVVGLFTRNWPVVHGVTFFLWTLITLHFIRRYWVFNAGAGASISFRVDGVGAEHRRRFEAEFRRLWAAAKGVAEEDRGSRVLSTGQAP